MIVRCANASDLEIVNKLLYQVEDLHRVGRPDIFKPGEKKYTDEQLLEIFLSDRTPVFVAVERYSSEDAKSKTDISERVLGYVFCIIQETKGAKCIFDHKTLYIDDLCVDESARGKGVGKILYDYTLDYARSIGCHNVTLHVWEKNPGARTFYEKMGMGVQQTTMEVIL
ncbi:MAG: GNAT family N-acetyltransferase [Bacteroidales bacterium]|nr:GNAT family N-acetyltransferase [Bacteroidales bacterium]